MVDLMESRIALVLSGGGARGAYQAGAILGLAEFCQECRPACRFSILSGVSAGAINAAFLASQADQFCKGAQRLAGFWKEIRIDSVFRTDLASLSSIGWDWIGDIIFSPISSRRRARYLLDARPLIEYLGKNIDFEKVHSHIQNGDLRALSISATDYRTAQNITFVESALPFNHWSRARRVSEEATIRLNHVCASAAIPLFFSPVRIGNRFFGDGCLRNAAPLSPSIHLGADALISIGVQFAPHAAEGNEILPPLRPPSIANILSVLLNSVLMDGINSDIERLRRINATLGLIPADEREESNLRIVHCFEISPSVDINRIASEEYRRMPRAMRYLFGGLGLRGDAVDLVSYLLFDRVYSSRLVEQGYKDVMDKKEQLRSFLQSLP